MKQRLIFLSLLVMLMGGSLKGWGQILTFDFNGLAGNEASANSNYNDANLSVSSIYRGAGLTATGNADRFNAENWALTSIANAVSGNNYMEFAITPNVGYQFNVSSIAVNWQRSSTGNTAIALRSSIDNFASDIDAIKSVTDNTSTQSFTWTITQTNSTSAVIYRLYSYAEATGGSGGPGDGTGNDIEINGSVSIISNDPMIGFNPNILSDISYFFGEGPSVEQSFTVTGINLTNDINLSAPTNYEISKSSGSGYTSLLTYTPAEASNPQAVYVRLKAGLGGGNYTGELITATSTGAETKNLTLNGRVKSVYAWTNSTGGSWTTSSNWNPSRTTPANDDRLLFNDGNTYTITDFASETIEGLFISNNTKVNLNSSSGGTLSIGNGSSGYDLIVESGCQFNISQSSTNALIISVGTNATASISGSMDFSSNTASTANQFIGTDASSVNFEAGSIFTQNTNSSGNVFGNGTTGSVVFMNGSSFIQADGSNPFATSGGVVIFEQGSLFKIIASGVSTSFAGRSYSNFEMDYDGTISASNTTALSFDNLTITQGTFNLNSSGTPGHSIKGNISVASGASLNFNPSSAGTINLSGTSSQTISGGGTITSNANSSIVVNNSSGVVLDNNANFTGNLTIQSGSTLTVKEANQLTISGTLTNSAGTSGLVIESDATGTGSLIHSSNGVAATVERYIPGVSYAWHLLGAPVAAQGISGDWIAGNYDFYSWDEAQALWLNQKVGANNLTSFTPGKGYLVAYETAALTKSFSGNLNNGDVVVAVTKDGAGGSNGANLLANPYPSGIDWFTATKTLFADNFAYVYDQTANGGAGAFVSIDGSANNAWIAPHQGFFVVAQTAGNFTFTNTMREHGGTYTKNTTGIEDELAIRLSAETWFDVSRIRIREGSTSARDRNDALHFSGFTADAPQLYTLSEDGKQLSINALPAVSQETTISLGTSTPIEGAYSLSIETIQGQFSDKTLYLEDKLLNISHNLTTNGAYNFIGSPADSPTRFLLHFGAVGVSEQPESSTLKAYVVGDQLYFQLQGEALLEVVDMQGRVVQQAKVSGQGLTSSSFAQPAGAYVVRLVGSRSVQTAKVIVKQ